MSKDQEQNRPTSEGEEVLVLGDRAGDYYLIPREALERFKASAEEKAALARLFEDDVSGYSFSAQGVLPVNVSTVPSEQLKEMQAEQGAQPFGMGAVSMLPLTFLAGLFVRSQEIERYLRLEQSDRRMA